MVFDLNEFAVDTKKEEEGVWVDWDGCQFLIAGTGNKRYRKLLRKKGTPFATKLKHGGNLDKFEDVHMKIASKCILLDWKEVVVDGESLLYSSDNAYNMFVKMPRFFSLVMEYADDVTIFKNEEEEEDRGNSESV